MARIGYRRMAARESPSAAGKVCGFSPAEGCIFYLRNQKLSRKPQGARCQSLKHCLFDRLARSCLGAVPQASAASVRRIYSVFRPAWIVAWGAVCPFTGKIKTRKDAQIVM